MHFTRTSRPEWLVLISYITADPKMGLSYYSCLNSMGLPIISVFPLYDKKFNFERLKIVNTMSIFSPADTLGIFMCD